MLDNGADGGGICQSLDMVEVVRGDAEGLAHSVKSHASPDQSC
jgi:hypothetical protein